MSTIELLAYGDTGWGDEIIRGTAMTLLIAVLGFLGGLLVGLLIAVARLSKIPPLRALAATYVTVVRGVPELLIIYLLFFGGGRFYRYVGEAIGLGHQVSVDAFAAGVCAVIVISAAYSAEVLRGAFQAIPRGQLEAARAFGMKKLTMLRHVIIPQVLTYALPSMGNNWQLVIKDTALISVTGLVELMRTVDVASGATHKPFVFSTIAIIIFLLFTGLSNWGFGRAERWFNRHVQKRETR